MAHRRPKPPPPTQPTHQRTPTKPTTQPTHPHRITIIEFPRWNPPMELTPTQNTFRTTYLSQLPKNTNSINTSPTTYITTTQPDHDFKAHLLTIHWHQPHIYAYDHQQSQGHQINRADPNWLQKLNTITINSKNHYQKYNAPCTQSTKSSKQASKTKATQ